MSTLMSIRRALANAFVPGTCVRVKLHRAFGIEYDHVWVFPSPVADKASVSADLITRLELGQHAVIVAIDNLGARWLMLLGSSGVLGWTDETEGLEVITDHHEIVGKVANLR